MEIEKVEKLREVLRRNWTLLDELLQELEDTSVRTIVGSSDPAIVNEERGKLKIYNKLRSLVD